MARLDRLASVKEISQIASVIGREFSYSLLRALVGREESALKHALTELDRAELVYCQGEPPESTYTFKHSLVRDAAYGTLLRQPRRALHATIAEALQNKFAEIAENKPELLARHCTEAGLIEKAVDLWGKAGQRSLARSALAEAATQLTRALDQIATLPATPALRQLQMELQVGLVNALMHFKGYAAPETKAAEEQARLLIEQAEALGEFSERPTAVVLGSLRRLGQELCRVQRRRDSQHRSTVSGARREAPGDGPAHGRASTDGHVPALHGKRHPRPGAPRPRDDALRRCRGSAAADAIWPGRPGVNLALSVARFVAAWLSRRRARSHKRRARARARDRPRRDLDVRAHARLVGTHPFWTLCGGKCGSR